MEIIQKFGLETKLFFFQLINFLIIAFILKKFLYAPLKKILDERKRKIEQSIQDAENIKLTLENTGEEKRKILEEAINNANALTAATNVSIEETKQKARAETKLHSQQIIYDAKQKATAEFENMNKQISSVSIDISEKIMSKVLSNLFNEEDKEKIIARALEKINEKSTN